MHPDPFSPIADAQPIGDPIPLDLDTDEDDIDESEFDDDPDSDDDGGLDDDEDDLEDDIDSRLSALRPPFPALGTAEAAEFGPFVAVVTCQCDRCETLRRDEAARDRWLSRQNCPEVCP